MSNQCHHSSFSRSLCYWTWFTETEQFSEKYAKINFRRMGIVKVEDISKSCWKTLHTVCKPFESTCYKTTLLSRFKLPSTDKLSRWESTKWKRVETTTFDATLGCVFRLRTKTHPKISFEHVLFIRKSCDNNLQKEESWLILGDVFL